jgi:hypothetical protein
MQNVEKKSNESALRVDISGIIFSDLNVVDPCYKQDTCR